MAKKIYTKSDKRPEHPLHVQNYPTDEQIAYDTRPGKDFPNTRKDVNLPAEKKKKQGPGSRRMRD